jgi:3'-phosphoadenosine 5'-phosphosulfate sulfotransferase (PAPS reductase)/FAD synthetase
MDNYEFVLEDTKAKIISVLSEYGDEEMAISYSGGQDSDVVLHLVYFLGFRPKIVHFETGLEFEATKNHIEKMIDSGYEIEKIKPTISIPKAKIKYGVPFINKRTSDYLQRLQKHSFDFVNDGHLSFDALYTKYPRCKSALMWWTDSNKSISKNIAYNKHLKEFLIKYDLPFRVSAMCCDTAKKRPIKKYNSMNGIKLNIVGLRRSEGGVRNNHKSCVSKGRNETLFFPLFWWTDEMKFQYMKQNNIVNSACYTDYGMKRTGCAACPLGRELEHELVVLEKNEPKLFNGVSKIFSDSIAHKRAYQKYKRNQPITKRGKYE